MYVNVTNWSSSVECDIIFTWISNISVKDVLGSILYDYDATIVMIFVKKQFQSWLIPDFSLLRRYLFYKYYDNNFFIVSWCFHLNSTKRKAKKYNNKVMRFFYNIRYFQPQQQICPSPNPLEWRKEKRFSLQINKYFVIVSIKHQIECCCLFRLVKQWLVER